MGKYRLNGVFNPLLVAISIALTFQTACVKKRPDIEAQGANLGDLVSMNEVKSWKHTITTSSGPAAFTPVSDADEIKVNKEVSEINVQGLVDWTSDSPLLQRSVGNGFKIIGLPGKTYPLVYKFTATHLKIYKKVPSSELAHNELPYAEADGANSYIVPIMGYEVSYFTTGKVKNADNRETNQSSKFPVDYRRFNEASHVSLGAFQAFERYDKKDVFPAKYFTEGEWYFIKSVVATKPGHENGIGRFEEGISTGLELANRIRFRQHKGYLRGVNAAIADQKLKFAKKEADAEDDVITIPVMWADFAVKTDSIYATGMKEILDDELPDHKRKYGRFFFAATNMFEGFNFIDYVSSKVIRGVKLEQLSIGKDTFSYTLLKVGSGEKTRYSFRKVLPSDYQPRVYRKKDSDIFGAFWTDVPYVITAKDDRKADIEAYTLLNRYNPKKPIIFRFSSNTPKWEDIQQNPGALQMDLRAMGRYCTKYWNRAFEVAGTGVKVELREDEDAELGDLNHNVINIIDTLNEYGMAGVGPTTADPMTGEIIAGAANVYIAPYRKIMTGHLRNYIRLRSGLVRDFAFSKQIQKEQRLMDHFQKEVEHFCPDVTKFADSLDGKPQISSENENKHIDACLPKLLFRVMTQVTCHEMGHVFNMRHNFEASADPNNGFKNMAHMQKVYPKDKFPEVYRDFYPRADFLPQATSVMDYMPEERPFLVVPGLYDIAQLAFYYGGKVVKAGTRDQAANGIGQFISYDTSRPLKDQPNLYAQAQKFSYCTDHEAGWAKQLPLNPFCARHDYGNTPLALMDFFFQNYIRDEIVLNFRKWDRYAAQDGTKPMYGMEAISSIYKLWRAHLYDFVGRDNAHLQDITDEESYEKLKADLKTRFKHKEFEGVNERYVKYMTSMFEVPDLYCVAIRKGVNRDKVNGNSDIKLMQFKNLFTDIVAKGMSDKVEGCMDPLVNQFVNSSNPGWDVIGEIGYPADNVSFSKAKEDLGEGIDIAGLDMIRQEALARLTTSLGMDRVYELQKRNHRPNPLDEPFILNSVVKRIETQLFDGLDASGPVSEMLASKGFTVDASVPIKPYKKFENEWRHYANALNQLFLFRNSEDVVDSVKDASRQIYTISTAKRFADRRVNEAYYYYDALQLFLFASPTESVAYKVLNKFREMEEFVRFDLGVVDKSSQEGLWQLAEVVRELPVTWNQRGARLDYNTFMRFAGRVRNLRGDPKLDAALKGSALEETFAKIEQFHAHIDSLHVAAQSPILDGLQVKPEEAKTILAQIKGREAKFAEYLQSQTGLDRDHFTQKNLAQIWIASRPSPTLQSYWANYMVKEIDERVRFFNEDKREYDAQRMALMSLLVSKLNYISRDPL